MSSFAKLLNEPPMDPGDARFFFAVDLSNVIDDGGTLVNPTATIEQAGTDAGVVINDVAVQANSVIFRPTVALARQADAGWHGIGQRFLVTITIDDAFGRTIERSVVLWIAQR